MHYQDKEDLLLENLEERLTNLTNDIVKHPLIFWFTENNNNLIKSIFEIFKENSDVYAMITYEQSNKVYNRIQNMTADVIAKLIAESPWAQKKVHNLPLSLDYVIVYFSGAMWSSVLWWAKNNYSLSTDEMAKSFRTLFLPSLLQMLKMKNHSEIAEQIVP